MKFFIVLLSITFTLSCSSSNNNIRGKWSINTEKTYKLLLKNIPKEHHKDILREKGKGKKLLEDINYTFLNSNKVEINSAIEKVTKKYLLKDNQLIFKGKYQQDTVSFELNHKELILNNQKMSIVLEKNNS